MREPPATGYGVERLVTSPIWLALGTPSCCPSTPAPPGPVRFSHKDPSGRFPNGPPARLRERYLSRSGRVLHFSERERSANTAGSGYLHYLYSLPLKGIQRKRQAFATRCPLGNNSISFSFQLCSGDLANGPCPTWVCPAPRCGHPGGWAPPLQAHAVARGNLMFLQAA